MPYAVIMAGGRGEIFWSRSRMFKPKQFLNLIGDKTML
jgi:mannose-1-phosphate guanylyltransferase